MTSYFRNLFGGSSSSKSSGHSRSHSTPAPIYATPSASSSTNGLATPHGMGRSYSHSARSNMPSPLRYATGTDTRAAYGYGRAPPASHHGHGSQPEARPQRVRRASYKTPDTRKWLFASLDYVTFAQCCMLTRNCARSAIRAAHAFGLLRDAAELAIEL